MRNAYCVIGANYGDEGKGLIVDRLVRDLAAAGKQSIVIRHNGTAQAAHTVCVRNETGGVTETVFSHFGAGTLAGATTVLAPTMFVHPAAIVEEYKKLVTIGAHPMLLWSAGSQVITPFDVAMNQLLEKRRGADAHGSCGMGMFEAFKRAEESPQFTLDYFLHRPDGAQFPAQLLHYFERRAHSLGFKRGAIVRVIADLNLGRLFQEGLDILRYFPPVPRGMIRQYDDVIFEGAQGLALDPILGKMPHCTPSNTGIRNIPGYLARHDVGPARTLIPIYVTRTYQTRHGNGPFPQSIPAAECIKPMPGFNRAPTQMLLDDTNRPNAWQGQIAYAPLDVGTVCRIARDLDEVIGLPHPVTPKLAVTWLDALQPPQREQMLHRLAGSLQVASSHAIPLAYSSAGRTAADVTPHFTP